MTAPGEGAAITPPSFYHTQGNGGIVFSWLFSTDHKRIGIMYLSAILAFFAVGVTLGMLFASGFS
jgi:cytochrome c oxidase subunit 1